MAEQCILKYRLTQWQPLMYNLLWVLRIREKNKYKCQVLSWNSRWRRLIGSLMQTDDIHSIKLLGTSWLVHVAYAANELTALHLNGWLVFTRAVRSALSEILWNPPPSLAPPVWICYGLLLEMHRSTGLGPELADFPDDRPVSLPIQSRSVLTSYIRSHPHVNMSFCTRMILILLFSV